MKHIPQWAKGTVPAPAIRAELISKNTPDYGGTVKSANISGLYKAASEVKEAGKIMAVKVTKMDTQLGRLKMKAHYVYMPDCKAYRDIIENGTEKQKADLANKFWLNQTLATTLKGCDLEIVEK